MGGIAGGGGGGGGKGGGGGGGSGGASDFDIQALMQAVGQNIEALHNRYAQLGLEVPSGDPLTAALHGNSLTGSGPSTMEQQDVAAQRDIGQAAIGQVQAGNVANPFAPGSPANLAELASQQQQFASASGSLAGSQAANAGGGSTSSTGGIGTGGVGTGGVTPSGNPLDAGTPPIASNLGVGGGATKIG